MNYLKELLAVFLLGQLFNLRAIGQEPMDLYLLIGQSNMAGRGNIDSLNNEQVPGIMMLDKSGQWVPAKDPLHFDKKEAAVGPGLSFGKEMLAHSNGRTIGLIPCAVGGTSITKWRPGAYDSITNAHPYDDAVRRTLIAMKSGRLKGIIWHQGESDSGGEAYLFYRKRFDSLLVNLARDLNTDLTSIPIVVGELGQFFVAKNPNGHAADINAILRQLSIDYKNISIVTSAGLNHKGDGTHFDAESARELGRRYAEAMRELQGAL